MRACAAVHEPPRRMSCRLVEGAQQRKIDRRAKPVHQNARCERGVGMRVQARIKHARHLRVAGKVFGDSTRMVVVHLHAIRQRVDAPRKCREIVGRKHAKRYRLVGIAETECDKAIGVFGLGMDNATTTAPAHRRRHGNGNRLALEHAGGNAIEGLHADMSTQLEGVAPKHRGNGVIDDEQRADARCSVRQLANVGNAQARAPNGGNKPIRTRGMGTSRIRI